MKPEKNRKYYRKCSNDFASSTGDNLFKKKLMQFDALNIFFVMIVSFYTVYDKHDMIIIDK